MFLCTWVNIHTYFLAPTTEKTYNQGYPINKEHTARSWFLNIILHLKEIGIPGEMTDSKSGAWKRKYEPRASHSSRK